MNRLRCTNTGEWINLGKKVGGGGEAYIYETNKPDFIAKIYTKQVTADTWEKLQLMINNPPGDPTINKGHISIVWPKCILINNFGQPQGFLLPYIANTLEFSVIYHPNERKQKAAGFNWLYLHATAMNIASVVQSIHHKNYVIGDINSRNFLVKPNTYVSIIDTDSFQVTDPRTKKVYRCTVGLEEYTPPEICGKNFRNFNRAEVHDRFGLAILIWQLLFNDHPFSGKWNGPGDTPTIAEKISQGHWVYGANSWNQPSYRTILFNIIHPQLQALFRRCFDDGNRYPNARPSATDWQNALEVAIQDLQKCSVAGEQHYFARSYGRCYWCERKNLLRGLDIFANSTTASIPNIYSLSLPTILKNHPGNSNISKSPPLPTITGLSNLNISTSGQVPFPIKTIYKPPKITPLNTNSTHPFLQWLQLKITGLKASKTQQLIVVVFLILSISISAAWQSSQVKKIGSLFYQNQTTAQNYDPKNTIIQYYHLVTKNRKAAIKLLSDAWRRQAAQTVNNKDNWWNSVRKVQVYAFQTFARNNNKAKIKVWLKYYMKNGQTACESLISNLIFDRNRNQWLMDSIEANSVVQNPYCDTK